MKENLTSGSIHLEVLHQAVGSEYDPKTGIRENKERILESLGFSKGKNVAIRREFRLPEISGESLGIKEYATNLIEQGRFFSFLFKNGRWESMGGAPVVYLMTVDDVDQKLMFSQNRLVAANAHDGKVINIDCDTTLQTYSRRRSVSTEISGFANLNEATMVNLGGGFRLQVDNVNFVEDHLELEFSGYFSFNDMGSRVLALSCKQDEAVPRYETTFTVKVDESGNFIYPFSSNSVYEHTGNADGVVRQVLGSLFESDGVAISRLIRGLLSVRPSLTTHQLEGIFSIPSLSEISAEVIDFDGIESFDLQTTHTLSPKEKLVQGKLATSDFLITSHEDVMSFVLFRDGVRKIVQEVVSSQYLNDAMRETVIRHTYDQNEVFSREFSGPVKLGRLLELLDISWEPTDSSYVNRFTNGEDEFIQVSIEGYRLGFWKHNDGGVIDTEELGSKISKLSEILGRTIVPAHLNYLREGD